MIAEETENKTKRSRKPRIPYEDNHKNINGIECKKCSRCNEWFVMNEENFYKNKANGIDGFHPYCKTCTKKKSSKWEKENPEKRRIAKRRYDDKPESLSKHRKRNKKWRDKGKQREWYANNPDLLKIYAQTRSTKTHEINKKEWDSCKSFFNHECGYCGLPEEKHKELYKHGLHREHVDPEGSNKLDNCIPACLPCNSSKGTRSLEDWYSEGNYIFLEQRLVKIIEWLQNEYKLHINNQTLI